MFSQEEAAAVENRCNCAYVKRKFIPGYEMKKYDKIEVQLHAFLTHSLDGGEWSSPGSDCFTSGVNAPGNN